MQFKTKLLFGAIALALAGSASASGLANGDLLLEVWDANTNVSYTVDLGVTESQFISEIGLNTATGQTSLTSPLVFNTADPLFAATFGSETTTSNITWNLVASNQVGTSVSGILSAGAPGNTAITNSGLTGANTRAIGLINTTADATSTGNNSVAYNTYNTDGYGGGANWSDNVGGNWKIAGDPNITTGNGYTSIDAVYAAGTAHGSGTSPVATFEYLTQNGADDTFSLSSNGTLTFAAAAVSNTPLPAAAWLLGSGLLGIFGIGRRKSGNTAA